jgi:hypothetical protein
MTAPSLGCFTRSQLERYTVDRVRLRKYGPHTLIDVDGRIYGPGMPWFRVYDNDTWRTLIVQAPSALHARRAALEEPEAWGGWADK